MGALFVSKLFISFSMSVRNTVLKEGCFDTWMILAI